MGGGGKGGSQSTKVEIPKWAEDAMKANLKKAQGLSEVGYMPYYGPDVAAFTPMQEMGMQGAYDAAAAFGIGGAEKGGDALAGLPEAKDFGGGLRGYSSGDLFEMARAEFAGRNPQQAAAYDKFFVQSGGGQAGAGFPSAYGGEVPPFVDPTSGFTEETYGGGAGGSGGSGGYGGTGPYGLPPNFPTNPVDIVAWLQSQGIDPSTFPR